MKKYSFEVRKREKAIEKVINQLQKVQWQYKNLILLIASVLLALFLLKSGHLEKLIENLENLSYLGAFFSGILYAFSLTIAPSAVAFYAFEKKFNPFIIASIGAFGTLIGDYSIFRFVKTNLMREIELIFSQINNKSYYFKNSIFYRLFPFSNLLFSREFKIMMIKASRSKIYNLFIKILAFLIIASPLPDEIAITLLGATKQKAKEFIPFSYLCNFIGILGISYFHRFS
jgi:hypothetical protein